MASKLSWRWKGGRLCRDKVSLSISEAYAAIPLSPSIAIVCRNVLSPYSERVIMEDLRAKYLAELQKKRILEGAEAAKKLNKSS